MAIIETPSEAVPPLGTIEHLPEWRVGDPLVGATLAIRREPLTAMLAPYRRFGRVFRMRFFGREHVVIAGLEANEFAWSDADQWDWATSGAVFREQFGATYLTQLTGDLHSEKRKRLSPAFRTRALARLAPTMADVWIAELESLDGKVVDLRQLCKRLVVRMAGRALLRVDLPSGTEDEIASLEHDLLAGAAMGPLRRAWFSRPNYRLRKRRLESLLAGIVRERKTDWSGDDMLSEILKGWPDGSMMPSVDELVSDMVLLLQAGSESTAHQILWGLLLLATHNEWREELRGSLGSWSPETAASPEHTRLRATVLETERFRPAIPHAVRIAARDLEFAGVALPAGTPIYHPTTLPHFLDEIYPNPMQFLPQRHLEGIECPRSAQGTFGGGSHICLGQPLARTEEPLALAIVTAGFELTLLEPVSLEARLTGVVSPVERAIPVRITKRR
jgi:cytochrome P450